MFGYGLGIYWKYTWCILIPIALLVIFIYAMVNYEPIMTDDGQTYPPGVSGRNWKVYLIKLALIFKRCIIAASWILAAIAIAQIPGWGAYVVWKQLGWSFIEVLSMPNAIAEIQTIFTLYLFENTRSWKKVFDHQENGVPKTLKPKPIGLSIVETTPDNLIGDFFYLIQHGSSRKPING